ncbi:MAG: ankyrin repeat domain-containing protein [Bacteroidota bacterium]
MRTLIIVFTLILSSFTFGQDNIFLDRSYWKTNPIISDVKAKIAESHDAAELNRFAFDAISYALIEKVSNATIKFLLEQEGNGVNKLTHDGRTYIFWAAYKDNLEMMDYLVKQGAKTNIIDSHGYSLLNFAAVTGQSNTKLYDFIIEHGADPKTEKNLAGANALLLVAPFLKDYELVSYFQSKGISLGVTDNIGNGIFNYAAKGGNTKMLDLLIKKGVEYKNLNKEGGNAFITASQGTRGRENTLELYQYLESLGLAVNVIGNEGRNPLHAIAYDVEDLNIFKFFLERGVDINQSDEEGNTPFLNAAGYNNSEVVSFLTKRVKDINATNKKGQSALTRAVSRNNLDVVNYLIENDASTKILDSEGNNLMYYVLGTFNAQKPEVFNSKLELLVKSGLDANATQAKGNTLYHLAAEKNNLDLFKRLQDFKIDINKKNDDGLTALHIAAMKAQNHDILNFLIKNGADKSIVTDFEETVYDLASENELLDSDEIAYLK